MEATLSFNLGDPDDKMAHMRCVKATDMAIVLFEIQNNIHRGLIDKDDESYNNGVNDTLQRIYSLMEEYNINIDELIN